MRIRDGGKRVEKEPDQEDDLTEASQQRARHGMRRQEEKENLGVGVHGFICLNPLELRRKSPKPEKQSSSCITQMIP